MFFFQGSLNTRPSNNGSQGYRAKFRIVGMEVLLAVEGMQLDIYVKRLNIAHALKINEVPVREPLNANNTVTGFYGALIYRDLSKKA